MWNHMSNYVENGNRLISLVHDKSGSEVGMVLLMDAVSKNLLLLLCLFALRSHMAELPTSLSI